MSKRSDDVAAQQRGGDLFKDAGRAGSARKKDKTDQTREPLLDIGSPHDSANGGEGMKLPGNQVSDSVSGFTQQQYMNPAQFYKNENQSRLETFLIKFRESAGSKANERKEEQAAAAESENSDVQSAQRTEKGSTKKEQLMELMASVRAPVDAKACVRVQNLKDYVSSSSQLIKNPRNAYFDLSRSYYNAKYNDQDNKKTIVVKSYLQTQDGKNYVKDLSMDIIQTQQGCMPVVKTFEYNAYNVAQFYKALKFYDYRKGCELVNQVIVDNGVMDEAYKTYDTSTLHFGNSVIFYKKFEKWQ